MTASDHQEACLWLTKSGHCAIDSGKEQKPCIQAMCAEYEPMTREL